MHHLDHGVPEPPLLCRVDCSCVLVWVLLKVKEKVVVKELIRRASGNLDHAAATDSHKRDAFGEAEGRVKRG